MIKKIMLVMGGVTLCFVFLGCSGLSRLERDYGRSFHSVKSNQILNPEADKNIEPVTGLDGQAAEASVEKYRKEFEKPAPPTSFVLGLGGVGIKQ